MKKYTLVFLLILIGSIFHSWFSFNLIVGGDLNYIFPRTVQSFGFFPFSWMMNGNNGIGGNVVPFLNSQYNQSLIYLFSSLNLSWVAIERITQLYPVLIILLLSSVSIYKLFRVRLFILSYIIFSLNTYILMLLNGGQTLVAMGYALTPIIFYIFTKTIENLELNKKGIFYSILLGLVLGLEVMVDLRLAYIAIIINTLWFLFNLGFSKYEKKLIISLIYAFVLPFIVVVLLNSFWVIPLLIVKSNPFQQLGAAYSTTNAVQYFSFAKFEDAMGLLHPNWPENIFGFTHFMRPEFLLLPILAFGSLLFVDLKNKKTQENKFVLFFALLGLIGIFLAKGANDPFGGVYLWMFGHIPGFMMFRDPTKWYVLIALSYAVLIPYTVGEVYEWVKKRDKFLIFNFQFLTKSKFFNLQNAFLIFIFGYLLFLIRPALFGQLGGTFKAHTLPQEYVTLEKYLSSQQNFSRVMWIPSLERFGYYSATHPAVGAEEFYHVTSTSGVLTNVQKQATEKNLQTLSVKYIIVPYDAEGELFVKDREYDNAQYIEAINALKKLPWLTEIPGFGRIHVFTLAHTKDHFWIQSDANAKVSYVQINPTKYSVQIKNAQKGDRLVFTDSFDSHWQMTSYGSKINSQPFGGLNSFVLPKGGNFTASLYYTPQDLVNIGLVISGVTVIVLLGYFSFYFLSSKKEKFFRDTSAK